MNGLVTIYESMQSHQVYLMKHHLDNAGIEAIILDNNYSSYTETIVNEMFVCKLQVRKEDEQRAKEILKEYNE